MRREVNVEDTNLIFGAVLFVLLGLGVLGYQLAAHGKICGSSGGGPVTCWSVR